jgi:acyl dehydratase
MGFGAEPPPARHVSGTDVGYRMVFGSYEDALRMVGTKSEPRTASNPVSGARIQLFAAMVHDGNRSYWDAEFARQKWGGLLAPPALLMGWLIPPPWKPAQHGGDRRPVASVALRVPLPGTTFINAANDVEFLQPIVEGDLLTVVEELVSVSPEKRTRLGFGHFVETLETYRRQDGVVVATCRNTLFRFTPGAPA